MILFSKWKMQSCHSRKSFKGNLFGGSMANGRCSRLQQIIRSTCTAFISTVDTNLNYMIPGRDGHGYGMGRVYSYPTQLIYLWIFNYLTQLVSIPNCYPVCLPMDIHTLPKPNFYKITKYAQNH